MCLLQDHIIVERKEQKINQRVLLRPQEGPDPIYEIIELHRESSCVLYCIYFVLYKTELHRATHIDYGVVFGFSV